MLTAEDVQRQVTVGPVVAVKETPLLIAMQRIVRGVQIQPHFFRCLGVGVQEKIHQHPVQGIRIRRNPVVTIPGRGFRPAQLQAVQRARTRQRIPSIPLPGSLRTGQVGFARPECQQAIRAQCIVIVEVFVAQGYTAHPLSDPFQHRVLDLVGIAIIAEAARNSPHQTQPAIHLAQQEGATVGGAPTRVETTYDLTPTEGVKCEWRGCTLYTYGTSLSV